jgi:HEAT repeat protein
VRAAAADLGRPAVTAAHVTYMASGLAHPSAKVRTRTAAALGALAHPAAVDLLVKAGPHAGAGLAASGDARASRAHVAFLNQRAYIRDFDVEVASAAFVADPKVDVLQSGTVLDVAVLGVTEVRRIVRTYRAALKQLTKDDPGADPRAWEEWRARRAAAQQPAVTGGR